jgi:hypothetical protein
VQLDWPYLQTPQASTKNHTLKIRRFYKYALNAFVAPAKQTCKGRDRFQACYSYG